MFVVGYFLQSHSSVFVSLGETGAPGIGISDTPEEDTAWAGRAGYNPRPGGKAPRWKTEMSRRFSSSHHACQLHIRLTLLAVYAFVSTKLLFVEARELFEIAEL